MKTFKDFLLEQSQAVKGDWIGDPKNPTLHLDTTGERAFNKKFKLEVEDFATIKGISLALYKHKTEPNFRVGYWKEIKEAIKGDFEIVNKFVTVVYLDADRNKDIQRKINKKFAMNIKMVFVDDSFRNNALARVLYNYIIHVKGYAIIGDKKQYFGARKLWSRLSKANDVIVDIINIKTGEILYHDVVLHQGHYDEDFDKRLWSYGEDKINIRSVLKTISEVSRQ